MLNANLLKTTFDTIKYLDDIGKPYTLSGKNVSEGWVNVRCIYCSDHSNHLGIHYEKTNNFNCWLCGESGSIIRFIMDYEEIGYSKALVILEKYQGKFYKRKKEERRIVNKTTNILPENFEIIENGKEPLLVKKLFKKRNFDLSLCQDYNLGYVDIGEYQYRVIIPIFLDGKVVSFQTMDATGQANIKYLSCPIKRSNVNLKDLVYGIDDIKNNMQVIVVEGVTDKWRIGKDAIALFGKQATDKQIELLIEKAKGKRIKILLDKDASKESEKLASKLRDFGFNELYIIKYNYNDPNDPDGFSEDQIQTIINA